MLSIGPKAREEITLQHKLKLSLSTREKRERRFIEARKGLHRKLVAICSERVSNSHTFHLTKTLISLFVKERFSFPYLLCP